MLWRCRYCPGENSGIFLRFISYLTIAMLQALERASRDQIKYAYLLRSTTGVVFLGTPLRGTTIAGIADWVAMIRRLMGKETSRSLLQSLKNEAASLDTLIHDFSKMAIEHKFQIRCFYETRRTQTMNGFSRQIAKLSPFPEVEVNFPAVFLLFYIDTLPIACFQRISLS